MTKDIPLPDEDRYDVREDGRIVERIRRLQAAFATGPVDFHTALELGRLGTVTSMRPNRVLPVLERARELDPRSPFPYKYMAIRNVEADFQYESALGQMTKYLELSGGDSFGHNFTGFLLFRLGRYGEAVESFERALSLNPDNCYAHCKTSRAYGMRYLKASSTNPLRIVWKRRALEHFLLARQVATPDQRRLGWLRRWLGRKNIATEMTPHSSQ